MTTRSLAHRFLVVISITGAAACGEEGGGDRPPGRPGPLPDGSFDRDTDFVANTAGLISLTEGPAGWVVYDQRLYLRLEDGLQVPAASLLASEGECEVWVHPFAPFGCEPACATGYCIAENTCVPFATPVDHGVVTVTGLLEPVRFVNTQFGYIAEPSEVPEELFTDDAVVTVSAEGGSGPAFALEASGVPAIEPLLKAGELFRIEDGVDKVIEWRAENSGRIQVALLVGHHGSPYEAMLVCETEDDGELVIPGDLITAFPRVQLELTQHPSWIARFSRSVTEIDAGPVELFVSSRALLPAIVHP